MHVLLLLYECHINMTFEVFTVHVDAWHVYFVSRFRSRHFPKCRPLPHKNDETCTRFVAQRTSSCCSPAAKTYVESSAAEHAMCL